MAALLYVLTHSTDDPDRAVTGLHAALAAVRGGHDVALWLTGEGVRLGVAGVAETLHETPPPGSTESAVEMLAALLAGGAVLGLDRYSFERRKYDEDVVREGAAVADAKRLAELLAEGRSAVTL